MSKKIAIITLYGDKNFGNKLQNYAVQCFFEGRGFDVETIPYWEREHSVYSLRTLLYVIKERMFHNNPLLKERVKRIKSFSADYIKLGKEVHYRQLDEGLASKYDYFVTGSDQVWHCWSDDRRELEFFLLTFAKPEQRLTIAPSFGFSTFPAQLEDVYKDGLKGFSYINCREKEGADLIHALTGQDAMVILDPTMLIETVKWDKIKRKPTNFIDKKYILTYNLSTIPAELSKALDRYCNENQYELVKLMDKGDKYYSSTRPDEFLYWIDNAELVVTDSFHAAVFSILFRSDFVVYSRHKEAGMENRIDTLLEKFYLQDRKYRTDGSCKFYRGGHLIKEKVNNTDFSKVESVLLEEREKADKFYLKCMDI